MTKKQKLTTCLAGTLALGVLVGCSNKTRKELIMTVDSETIKTDDNFIKVGAEYFIEQIPATSKYLEDGTVMLYTLNNEWGISGSQCFRVVYRETYLISEDTLKDGTKVIYSIDGQGYSNGSRIYLDTVITDTYLRDAFLANQLETNKLTLG